MHRFGLRPKRSMAIEPPAVCQIPCIASYIATRCSWASAPLNDERSTWRTLRHMARRRSIKKKILLPDPVYQNHLVEMIANNLMRRGKKLLAYRICYSSMREVGDITQKDPVSVLEQAVRNVTPLVEVKSKRRGGATYQVPVAVTPERGTTLAIRWILASCRNRSGRTMVSKLTNEFLDASKNMGAAIKRKEEINRMAEANKAYAANRF